MIVVHGEDIFVPLLLPFVECCHGTGTRARVIERFCKRGGALIERLLVVGFVNANTPDDNGGMVAITDDHVWADREGGVGVRYDKDKLVAAILAAKKESDPDTKK